MRRKKPAKWLRIAKERIKILFTIAENEFDKHPERSKRYIQLAKKIAMRYNIRIPKPLKRKFCKKCFSLLKPGKTARIRTSKDKQSVIITCLMCGHVKRYPYIREKKENKN
ncbi:MAG: ribonuclease P [Candidatus Aenigmarchaeota archaeon]|nr:ribonuclease P [Candidatus Aenigmarchaeota archaeon]